MICTNQYLRVKFDTTHNSEISLGGISLHLQHEWTHKNESETTTKLEENTNLIETKPQICTVLADNPSYPYKVGDRLFVHYMAWETAVDGDLVTNEAFIYAYYVFITILSDGHFKCADGIFIGEQVYTEEQATPSGIIFDLGQKKEQLKVKITHIPEDNGGIQVGDTVVSIDKYNYEFSMYPNKYIKLTKEEIAGKVTGSGLKAMAL